MNEEKLVEGYLQAVKRDLYLTDGNEHNTMLLITAWASPNIIPLILAYVEVEQR